MSKKTTNAAADTAAMQDTTVPETVNQADAQGETVLEAQAQTVPVEIPAAYADYEELSAVVAAPLGLNLRNGPGAGYGVLGVLSSGAPVTVLPLPYGVEVKDWALVVSESGTRGWVMTKFLTEPPVEE